MKDLYYVGYCNGIRCYSILWP